MGASVKLYVDIQNKKLVATPTSSAPVQLPTCFQGDVIPFEIYLLEPDPTGAPNSYTYPAIGGMTLKFAIGAQPIGTSGTPTPFVTEYDWDKNTTLNKFSAEVNFNTNELNTWLAAQPSAEGFVEIEITEGTAIWTVYQGKVTIKAQLIEIDTSAVADVLSPISRQEAIQLFVKYAGNPAGATITTKSSNGNHETVWGTDDDGNAVMSHQVPF